ncbi:MAG: FtsQ-type POTRA domain-containing protein [Acidobacteriota bacterium]|nr:FtsQ-type POTRA domain-containing protein [Acidobacteriota bacterium]
MRKEAKPATARWRLWLTIAAWFAVFVSTALAARKVQRFVMTDARFEMNEPELRGVESASRARILQSFAPDAGRSIFRLPLAERRRRLLAIDWVEDASLSRIWPNQVVVRIHERKPVAFVILPAHRYALIDSQGVLLSPPRRRFDFPVLSGITENQDERDRRDRVHAMLRLLDGLGTEAAKNISEVNASNVVDLRLTTQVQGHAVELWMGDRNFGSRYENFLRHFTEIRSHSGIVSIFDLRLDDRIITR